MKKYFATLLIIPVIFMFASLAHADDGDASSTDATTTIIMIIPSGGGSSSAGLAGGSIVPTSAAQKIEVLEYKLSILLAEWKYLFGMDYPAK